MIFLILYGLIALLVFAGMLYAMIKADVGQPYDKLGCAAVLCGALWPLMLFAFLYTVYRTEQAQAPIPVVMVEPEPLPLPEPLAPVKQPRAPRKKKVQDTQ